MEKNFDCHADWNAAPPMTAQDVLGNPRAAANADAGTFSFATPTHGPVVEHQQLASSFTQAGHVHQARRTCVQPLPLRPIALESALVAQQRRGPYANPAHQQMLQTLPGYQFSPGRSPCTPTTSDSGYLLSYSPCLTSVSSERAARAGTDVCTSSRTYGQTAEVGGLSSVLPRNCFVSKKPAPGGLCAVAPKEFAVGHTRPLLGRRKFSPNIDASRDGGSLLQEDRDPPSSNHVKEESDTSTRSCLGVEEGLMNRALLNSMQSNSNGLARTKNDTSAGSCSGVVSAGTESGGGPHGHAGKIGNPGAPTPAPTSASARIMESNARLLHQQMRSLKEGRGEKVKKSKDLLEVSWFGRDAKDENGTSALYTPVSLPFILKEEVEEEDNEHTQDSTSDAQPAQKTRLRRTRRPTARHVEEANRFAAGLLLADGVQNKSSTGENSDTWDFADDAEHEGVEFLHLYFPFAFPPLDRQAMMKARESGHTQVRRSDSDSTTDSGDGRACSEPSSFSNPGYSKPGNTDFSNVPLQPSPPLRLPELPAGRIGRLLVHRSGRVKLQLLSSPTADNAGHVCASESFSKSSEWPRTSASDQMPADSCSEDIPACTPKLSEGVCGKAAVTCGKKCRLQCGMKESGISFEVNVGSECTFAQDVGCFFRDTSEFLFLGRCNKRLVVAPDIKNWLATTQGTSAAS